MVAIAYCFSGLPTPSIRPQGLVGHFPNLHCPSLKFAHLRTNFNTPMATTPFQVSASSSSSTIGAPDEEKEVPSSGRVGANDLLIVGPGVLGRLVAQKWREEHPGCEIHGQTMTVDHHEELSKVGINPCLKGTKTTHKFPYVIFCAPPSRTSDYPGDVRLAALNWNGEGSFLFTSSSAPYDCNDNGPCDEDTPAVPIGRSPRTDVLLKAEKVVLEFGGVVLRLAGLYISFMKVEL
ncbi:PREDICTED: NAD(P)-dependent oxidoreductase [Prunus dulcis]|uniref:PREDICTED: NAD(P)-dependent oxidoreductase n=1 Tax=Prunus dulcis TaxID=3755 RepID=A0A5E4EQG3_PRUDU|nr:PREDICTED: NAD(P)-dependent oxidoreductase [Prunus dulcis]